MAINITNFNNLIRSYIVTKMQEQFPDLDVSENSVFDDIFVKPLQEIISPIIDTVNSMEFMLNLDNAYYMSEDELDEIGMGNYLIQRKQGTYASTYVTLSFLTIPNTTLTIPEGATFRTESGLFYSTQESYEFTYEEMLSKYNVNKMTYDVDVLVVSNGIGEIYNVSESQITVVETNFGSYTPLVTNKSAITNATDKESNVSYADRIKEYYISRHLGTKPGYRQFIFSEFNEVEDLHIVGYGDEEMTRDLYTIIKDDLSEEEIHIGGKVDIYIKGGISSTSYKDLTINSGRLVLEKKYSEVDLDSINVTNDGAPVIFTVIDEDDDLVVLIDNTGEQSYDSSILNTIEVYYEDNELNPYTESFSVGLSSFEADTLFKGIFSIYETDDNSVTHNNDSYYVIERRKIDGTLIESEDDAYYESSQEIVTIKFITDEIRNGTSITIGYSINETIKNLVDEFDLEENRVITTDILFKETEPIFINVAMRIKLKDGFSLDDTKSIQLQNVLGDYFKNLQLGSSVEESDLIGELYRNEDVNTFIEYISVPLVSFYIPVNPSDAIIEQRDGTVIAVTNLQYPVLNKVLFSEVEV